ncbi:MAG: hypothetical protein JNM39_02405 [Bdellovibrionaceae bacterium]|nr:hypothetical protein [Pseudobdellovibrionaceae bacterium]
MNVHIFGASGSGATTLGRFLAVQLNVPCFDSDDYFWKKTDPPFQVKNSIPERQRLLLSDLQKTPGWILSGSLDSWSEPFLPLFNLVVFLYLPSDIRLERIRQREAKRFGDRICLGGDMHQAHLDFLAWAGQYDQGALVGRNRQRHEEWMASLTCPVLRIENVIGIEDATRKVLSSISTLRASHSEP